MKSNSFITGFLRSFVIFVAAIAPGSLRAQGDFVYTNNNPAGFAGSNTVSALSVGTNGTLTPIADRSSPWELLPAPVFPSQRWQMLTSTAPTTCFTPVSTT
jgi:hypothetical protein